MSYPNAKILVVDDVAENRDLLIRRLKRLGLANVDEAVNGVEALAVIAAKSYDLVLLDIMMPELDGFGVLTALREQGRHNDMPVIVISAMNEIDAVVRCVELGAEDFLFKPFNPTLLRARVLATLEKKSLRDQTREELRRKQHELNEARTLQLALVPPPFSGTLGGQPVAVDIVLEPAKEVGGDLVDHFQIGENLLVMLLGDVSDKGAGAALMMARTHAIFRSLAGRPDAEALFADPAKAMDFANAALSVANASCMFVTLLLGTLDLRTRELRYVRAGHVPPFHRNGTGTVARLPGEGGPPLGLFEEIAYQSATAFLAADDQLLIVTDGFTEAHDPAGSLYGEARIEAFLAALSGRSEKPLERLIAQVRAFEAGRPAFDDMAAILLSLGTRRVMSVPFEAEVLPQPEAISALTEQVMDYLAGADVDARTVHHVALAFDELLTNLGSHGGSPDQPAKVRVVVEPDKVRSEIQDNGAAFDIREAAAPVLTQNIEEREIGGLGLFLIRQFASEIGYERRDGKNCTSFTILRNASP